LVFPGYHRVPPAPRNDFIGDEYSMPEARNGFS
jgi:hypothetical protein